LLYRGMKRPGLDFVNVLRKRIFDCISMTVVGKDQKKQYEEQSTDGDGKECFDNKFALLIDPSTTEIQFGGPGDLYTGNELTDRFDQSKYKPVKGINNQDAYYEKKGMFRICPEYLGRDKLPEYLAKKLMENEYVETENPSVHTGQNLSIASRLKALDEKKPLAAQKFTRCNEFDCRALDEKKPLADSCNWRGLLDQVHRDTISAKKKTNEVVGSIMKNAILGIGVRGYAEMSDETKAWLEEGLNFAEKELGIGRLPVYDIETPAGTKNGIRLVRAPHKYRTVGRYTLP